MTTSIIATSNFNRNLKASFKPRLLFGEVDAQYAGTRFQVHGMLASVAIRDPCFERVTASRQMFETIMTLCVGFGEERRIQHENGPAHPVVNVAMHGYGSRFIENDRAGLFIFAIAPEIKTLRF